MSDTVQVLLIDGKPIGYFPPTSAENVTYKEGVSVKDALDSQKIGSTVTTLYNIVQWATALIDNSYTMAEDCWITGTFYSYGATGGATYVHGIIVSIDGNDIANYYSTATSPNGGCVGNFLFPLKKGQVLRVRNLDGTFVGIIKKLT